MSGRRSLYGWVLVLGVGVPACQTTRGDPRPTPVAVRSQFADLSPGDRIAVHPNTEPPRRPPEPPVPSAERVSPPADEAPVASVPTTPPVPYPLPDSLFPEDKPRSNRAESPLVSAVRAHVDSHFATAVGHLAGYEKPNQELLLLLLPVLDTAASVDLTRQDPKTVVLARQLDAVRELLERKVPLTLGTTTFVSYVRQFGDYDPLPASPRFAPGSIACIYAEVNNVPSEPVPTPNGEPKFVTRLNCSLQLADTHGQPVELPNHERKLLPKLDFRKTDFTRSSVRDVFLRVEFTVPERPGKYTLTLDVRDPDDSGTAKSVVRSVRRSFEFVVGR